MKIFEKLYAMIINSLMVYKPNTMKQSPEEVNFIEELKSRGYAYNEEKQWHIRTWTANAGKEKCYEAFRKDEDSGKWNQIMIGANGDIFYEESYEIGLTD